MEVTGTLIIPEERFEILETFPDGGMLVNDRVIGNQFKSCPFCRVGDCLTEAIDALDCPRDYTSCQIYKDRRSNLS